VVMNQSLRGLLRWCCSGHYVVCLLFLAVHQTILPASTQGTGPDSPSYGLTCEEQSAYMTAHPRCRVFGYCHEVECVPDNAGLIGALTVHSCEDPVRVVLRAIIDTTYGAITQDLSWSGTLYIGTEVHEICVAGNSRIYITSSSNASHLHFEVSAAWTSSMHSLRPLQYIIRVSSGVSAGKLPPKQLNFPPKLTLLIGSEL
jgi:hypothetical protein